jgi:hypothetical protein
MSEQNTTAETAGSAEAIREAVYNAIWEDIVNDPKYPSVLSAIVEGTRQAISEYLHEYGLPDVDN